MKETLKLALEALENSVDLVREDAYNAEKLYGNYPSRQGKVGGLKVLADDHEKAITALKEALAQTQEPVAWWNNTGTHIDLNVSGRGTPLYTHPPQRPWVDLTEDELVQIGVATGLERAAVEMISNKLKEKNT